MLVRWRPAGRGRTRSRGIKSWTANRIACLLPMREGHILVRIILLPASDAFSRSRFAEWWAIGQYIDVGLFTPVPKRGV